MIFNVDKNRLGLGNVDNTSDKNKPVSTAQQSAINNVVGKIIEPWNNKGYKYKGTLVSSGGTIWRAVQNHAPFDNTQPWNDPSGTYWEKVYPSDVILEHQQQLDVIGELQTVTGTATSVETTISNSAKTLASITLEKGIYNVVCQVSFPNNSSIGTYRRICLLTHKDTPSASLGVANSCAPAQGITTSVQLHSIMNVVETSTYYLNAQHDAGATLSCQGFIRAVRIA